MEPSRYWKPRSLTWWGGMAMVLSGAFMAFEPVHELATITDSLSNLYGGLGSAALINAGLVVIGLRASTGDAAQ